MGDHAGSPEPNDPGVALQPRRHAAIVGDALIGSPERVPRAESKRRQPVSAEGGRRLRAAERAFGEAGDERESPTSTLGRLGDEPVLVKVSASKYMAARVDDGLDVRVSLIENAAPCQR